MSTILRLFMYIALLLPLMGCEHRELCYDHSHWLDLTFEFDWSDAPDAAPQTMVVYLFPVDGSLPHRYEFGYCDKAVVRAPAGIYNAVAINGGTETLVERGKTFETFDVASVDDALLSPMTRFTSVGSSSENVPRFDATADEPVRKSPDRLWSDTRRQVNIEVMNGPQTVRFKPKESTVRYNIILKGTEKISGSLEVCASLSTMAESFSPYLGKCSGIEVTVPVALHMQGNDSFEGSADFFGHCPKGNDGTRHILTVYTSTKKYFHFDVTDQMHAGGDSGEITIVVSDIPFPNPDEGTGMQPEVSGWDDVINSDIDMN